MALSEWKNFYISTTNGKLPIAMFDSRRRVDQKSTTWPRLLQIWVQWTSLGFQLLCLSPSPRLGRWKSKTLGRHFDQQLGSLAHEIQVVSDWVSECVRDGIHHVTSSIYLHYIIYTSYTSYCNSAPIRLTGIHQPILNQVCTCFEALKPWIYGWWHCFTNIKSSQFKEYPIITYIQIHMKISSNHHKSSPMILKIGSQISNRYPTDIQSSSDRGRLPLPLRHRALWQGALGTGADGPGGGAPGHARQVPWLQWRRQKPWGKIDGENHGKIRKSMETWKKNYRQSEKPCEIDWNWGHSGFNCYLWCFLVGNRRRGWDAAMVHIWFICWSSCSMIPVPFGAWHVFPQNSG